jgi:hypothetical protein
MTDDAQKEALAEFIGWRKDVECVDEYDNTVTAWRNPEDTKEYATGYDKYYLPSVTRDLNAIHEVEKHLNMQQREKYIGFLLNKYAGHHSDKTRIWMLLHATVQEKCEALLRALDLWTS